MSITLQTIQTRMQNRLKDITDLLNNPNILYDMATDLNQFLYRKTFAQDPERLIQPYTYTVGSSPSTQSLPAGFRDIQSIGCGFFLQNSSGVATEVKLVMTSYGSISQGFYISGGNVVFTGINSTSTIVLRYIPTLADITSLSGVFCVDDEFKEMVLSGMVMKYYQYEEDPREGIEDEKFARLLGDYLSTMKKAPNIFRLSTSINQGA